MTYYPPIEVFHRCQALCAKTKQRCAKDATHFHAGKNLCSQHHTKALEARVWKKVKA